MKIKSRKASKRAGAEDGTVNLSLKKGRDSRNALDLRRKTAEVALITSSASSASKKKQSGWNNPWSFFIYDV